MDLRYTPEDEQFRAGVREWLGDHLAGEFAALKGLGGSGREHEAPRERQAWNQHLAAHGWTCLGWPVEYGGRGLSLLRQVIFHEEYARSNAPARVNHLGEELLGPTLIAHGTDEQRRRFLPGIAGVTELWCQGYSEPGAGSDLAGVRTRARPAGGEWVIDGQKIWTSLAQHAQWCFAVVRTEPGSRRHAGLSYLLVPMDQPGVEVRPIRQLTGTSEFNEVFFDGARTEESLVVGEPGDGWRVAMATLGFERGVSTIGQQVGFARELAGVVAAARANGRYDDPVVRDRLARAAVGLEVLRVHALRTLSAYEAGSQGPEASVSKLLWARWHRELGELAMEVRGGSALTAAGSYDLDAQQTLFLFSRADTIYGGSDEIQRNIIAERVLGLPREPRP
ncbi:acyl-CoA dehydrogenase [Amycolatopsis rubida]|uniref:Acyl-CoA dehydrogenase n=1 Tax=Amycolatopsis rubida TaxID=112413 RepID=A0A1I5LDK7_9PSEU|nr:MULTISPECIES: acyl-CoA dehydrogenase family protein [Amycolatopsis]MYW93851.1 acyl-CoA dehydrogenase [Amycolatopsis rubida]NEC58840.1 acyl-CoA dehydrogenase [Amycolatopsis rubida]OAP25343.1 Acyl-CoA dehydrogenase [Amycolatopsis sp. M39]SFO95449.1 Acyl-CoA dehydrogenase [Amycolatopsis rubida]